MKKVNSIVKKHNVLINGKAPYMDVRELRIVAQTAARITVNDKDFETYHIPIKDIATKNKNIYEEIKEVCIKLQSRIVKLEKINEAGKRVFEIYSIFHKCRYVEGSGFLETKFAPELKPYFLQLKNDFTQFDIETLSRIPSTYSYRLYELLKSSYDKYKKHKDTYLEDIYLKIEIQELQEKLNINIKHAPSYRVWGKFVQKVLDPAQKNLKKHTDISFTYEAWAEYGRKFTHIKFKIKSKTKEQKSLSTDKKHPLTGTDQVPPEILSLIPQAWREDAQDIATKILKVQSEEDLKTAIAFCNQALESGADISSYGAYMRSTCFENLFHLKQKTKAESDAEEASIIAQEKTKFLTAEVAKHVADSEALKNKKKNVTEKEELIKALTVEQLALLDIFIGKQELTDYIRKRYDKGISTTLQTLRLQYIQDFKKLNS